MGAQTLATAVPGQDGVLVSAQGRSMLLTGEIGRANLRAGRPGRGEAQSRGSAPGLPAKGALVTPSRSLVLVAVVLAAAAIPFRAAATENDADLIRQMANSLDPSVQARICDQILSDHGAEVYAHYFCEGFEAISKGEFNLGKASLSAALADQPKFATGPLLYGDLCARLGKPDLAERYYRQAISIQPDRTDTRFALGSLLVKRGQEEDPKYLTQALEAFHEMTQTDPSSPDGWSDMGMVLALLGRYQDAEEVYRQAIARNPKEDPALFDDLAAAFARDNKDSEAEKNWTRALVIRPGYGPAVVELAALYARTGRLEAALETLENGRAGIHAPPWGPRICRDLGFAYLRLGLNDAARERFTQATEAGVDALAYLGRAHLLMLSNASQAAVGDFEHGTSIDSTLALPFVRAWKDPLAALLQKQTAPALARELVRVAAGQRGGSSDSLPPSATGPAATPYLVGYVLEGWSFQNADTLKPKIASMAADTSRTGLGTPPEPVDQVAADYPEDAQESGMYGSVDVRVTVGETGKVIAAEVVSCKAPQLLCDSALAAAWKWNFKPAMRFGTPVQGTMLLPFRFVRPSN